MPDPYRRHPDRRRVLELLAASFGACIEALMLAQAARSNGWQTTGGEISRLRKSAHDRN